MIRFFSQDTIAHELRRRGILLLLHSTHLYKNLPQIIADGKLHTVRSLEEAYGSDASRYLHDPYRYERFAVGLDYINASLSMPNVELLYRRSRSEWTADWVHLALDLSLLSRDHTLFCQVSAAADMGKHLKPGPEGLREMFAGKVEGHKRDPLPHNVATHPQAEVLLHGSLTLADVRKIIVPSDAVGAEVKRLCDTRGRTMKIETLPHLFIWPKWMIKS
ncbi:MAG TPA: DarT ssDNA thymidine ADP-ribosyltransferase family protein [bacterium]|jgi:hypothetical protein